MSLYNKKKYNILFLGAGRNIPTFIYRRINALAHKGIFCTLTSPFLFSVKEKNVHNINEYVIKNKNYLIYFLFFFLLGPIRIIRLFRIYNIQKNKTKKKRLLTAIRFADLIRCQPDLIHVQWIAQVPEIAWMRDLFRVPIIASIRGSMVTVYPHKHPGYEQTLQMAFQLSDRLHFVSQGLLDFCVERFSLDKSKCFVNYNGIDTRRFRPAEQRSDRGREITLVSVGALIWRKNFQDLLKIVRQSNFQDRITLKIIGEGEEHFILEFMIRKYDLAGKIELLGKLSEDAIIGHLQDADIYLSASYAEGLSNAVMEAAACGLPVIAFDCEGMNEIIVPDKSGIIVPHGRVDLFVQALDQLIENDEHRRAMGAEARMHVEAHFREEVWVDAMIQEYHSLIPMKNDEIA